MKTKIRLSKRDLVLSAITLLTGILLGWLFFFHSGQEEGNNKAIVQHSTDKKIIWTCSMHPQIRLDHPGKCPICGMDLIPLKNSSDSISDGSRGEIRMTDEAMKIADIQTIMVKRGYPDKKIYLLGKVKPDERNIAELTARFGGRIEKLFVNFTGQDVRKGEKMATIYSPTLITAQKELLEAEDYRTTNPDFYRAARNKLKLWDLTEDQINGIEKKGNVRTDFDVLSPMEGTVTRRNVAVGDYVNEGSPLFQVTDLSRVWVMFDAYESDLPWIRVGDPVTFTIQSLPGKSFRGRIRFIDPVIDPKTRVAQVRIEVENPGFIIKPEMFANGIVNSSIAGNKKDLLIPRTSILWTGKRSVVFVKVPGRNEPTFAYREITLGPSAGDFYVVGEGLKEGEEIATNGVFRIDAAAQLAGRTSMMNPETEKTNIKSKTDGIDPEFKKQLTSVYTSYILMKNAFVQSDPAGVAKTATNITLALAKVDMELLHGTVHEKWMKQLSEMKASLEKIKASKDIKEQREAFGAFSHTFYRTVKDFGLEGVTAYYQYCPMAFHQKGAYWFSEIKDIRNPYFGDAMLKCGETRETLNY